MKKKNCTTSCDPFDIHYFFCVVVCYYFFKASGFKCIYEIDFMKIVCGDDVGDDGFFSSAPHFP